MGRKSSRVLEGDLEKGKWEYKLITDSKSPTGHNEAVQVEGGWKAWNV